MATILKNPHSAPKSPQQQLFQQASTVLLTMEDVRSWLNERDRLRSQIKEIDAKLEAAALLFPELRYSSPTGQSAETMSDAAKRIVTTAGRKLSHAEVRNELRKNPEYAEKIDKTPNYFYTMMDRLVRRGAIERDDKFFKAPAKNSAG